MAPDLDPPTREEPVVDLETWDKAGRAAVATAPIDTRRGMDPDPAE